MEVLRDKSVSRGSTPNSEHGGWGGGDSGSAREAVPRRHEGAALRRGGHGGGGKKAGTASKAAMHAVGRLRAPKSSKAKATPDRRPAGGW